MADALNSQNLKYIIKILEVKLVFFRCSEFIHQIGMLVIELCGKVKILYLNISQRVLLSRQS